MGSSRQRASSFHHFEAAPAKTDSAEAIGGEIPDTPHTRAYIEEIKSAGLPVIPFALPPRADRSREEMATKAGEAKHAKAQINRQTSLSDEYFDVDRHRPLESLVDAAEQELKSAGLPFIPFAQPHLSDRSGEECSANACDVKRSKAVARDDSLLSDDYFDMDRHRPLESLVDLAQQELMMMEGGVINLYEATDSLLATGHGQSRKAGINNNYRDSGLFYTPRDLDFTSISHHGREDNSPFSDSGSSHYLDMTAGMRNLRLHSEALPIERK